MEGSKRDPGTCNVVIWSSAHPWPAAAYAVTERSLDHNEASDPQYQIDISLPIGCIQARTRSALAFSFQHGSKSRPRTLLV